MSERFTKKQVLEAISSSGGVMSAVQQKLGCKSWATARKYVEKWSDTREAWATENSHADDLAQSVIINDIKNGNVQTAKWWLERRRWKDFYINQHSHIEEEEIDKDDNELKIEIVDNKNEN